MLMTSDRLEAAHKATPTCNAGATQPFYCHSLACRTKALDRCVATARRPVGTPQEIRRELVGLLERAAGQPSIAEKLGALEGGLTGILICLCGVPADEAVALASGGAR